MLIEGLEMPTGDDDVKLIINSDGSVHRIIGWAVSEKMNATAVPVPEHGDLIDRDALLNELKKYYKVGEIAEVGEVACFISDAEVVLERTT